MQFKKIVPYKIKRLIPMLGLAGATLAAPSCEKQIQQAAAPSDVHTVYLVPRYLWNNFSANTISVFANKLQEWIDASPKARGQGDFNFALGEASKVPEDSLRIVRNGWTINAYRQDPWQH